MTGLRAGSLAFVLSAFVLVAALATGCGEDDPAPAQNAAGSDGTSSLGGAGSGGGAGTEARGAAGSNSASVGPELTLTYGDASATVDVGKLPTQIYKDETVIPLSAIWAAGNVGRPASELLFDFEGDDGFKPSSKPKCQDPVKGADLDKGYLLPATRTLVWDDALGFAGCFGVRGLKTIIAIDP